MSVVGVDLGTLNTVIAVARNRGVDVITNEVSNRATPSLVGFGPKSRYIGEAAKNQEVSNLKNTVSSFTRLAGRSLNDPDVDVEKNFVSAPLVDINGQVGAEVTYLGKKEKFTATQITAMYLTRVKQTASAELKLPVADVVISVPAWYTDAQRRSLLDASEIAGLKTLRLINDTTAAALGWGITKLDLPAPEEKPKRVAFVNIGHSNYTASIVEFKKGELTVKSTAWDRHFGGRYIDQALVEHFGKEFKEKYKIDIFENAKAKFRVQAGVEKLKKILSANTAAPLNIESVMNDVDVRGMLKREELEELIEPLLQRATAPIEQALAEAKLKPEDIDAIEMIGGCTRVPALKSRIQEFFGKPLSFTLNQDEAVARGCAFSCAILSPVFRVRDFSVHDMVSYPIEFTWEKSEDIPDEDTSLTVFNKGNVMPSTKILTFYRKHGFDLEARYAKPEQLPGKTNPWIGRFSVKGVKEDPKGDFMICKLKARLNVHGVLNVESGYYVEEVEVEEPIPEEKKEGDVRISSSSSAYFDPRYDSVDPSSEQQSDESSEERRAAKRRKSNANVVSQASVSLPVEEALTKDRQAMDVDSKESKEPPKMRKVKKQQRKGDLPLSAGTAALDQANKDAAMEKENQMIMEDKLVADTEHQKNDLEAFIYELKDKILDVYAEFANDDEKARLNAKLEQTEDWLYDEGEDATKAQYVSKSEDIRSIAGPIIQRYNDKIQEEQAAIRKKHEEQASAKQAEIERKKREEEAKKQAEAPEPKDSEMTDAETTQKPDEVEEPSA
ncbi:adenyl-nucleotide exchange factor sse1 [Didymosphaeria variabile]|uniref:Adenyl-nucleotide exchange factor sse1 n=1 Tax=Didymosphaeria variabile TaxID=1932322 RepID=A0A9W8XKG9_9PLEO|nr:adenyl-nucleotide exchange factor sse1 [Didymosphaeria variabile]KAJ4353530.1 adenyl-nucleotide exchange factor sse1 [Didymosphaeria variabile]